MDGQHKRGARRGIKRRDDAKARHKICLSRFAWQKGSDTARTPPAEGFQNLGFGGVLFSLSFAEERKGAAGGKCSGRTESSAPTKCSKNPCKAGWDEKNKIVPGVLPRTMPKHRDTTLLRRLLTQVGLMKCRYTSALLRAPPSEPKAQVPSTRRLRSHVPPSVPRPLSPGRALFGGLKWGTLSFIATLKSYRKISLRFSDKRF